MQVVSISMPRPLKIGNIVREGTYLLNFRAWKLQDYISYLIILSPYLSRLPLSCVCACALNISISRSGFAPELGNPTHEENNLFTFVTYGIGMREYPQFPDLGIAKMAIGQDVLPIGDY